MAQDAGKSRRYRIPAEQRRVEEEIKRSRFITTVCHTPTLEAARGLIARVREEYADASHNCWAYVVGPPGSTLEVGMSDDGEPHGTAGKPMLSNLLNSGIGDIGAVVTRYWGGTKLGRGGLVRAYSGGVKRALSELSLREHLVYETLSVSIEYTFVTLFQRMLPEFEVEMTEEAFGAEAVFTLRLPEEHVGAFRKAFGDLTRGKGRVRSAEGESADPLAG